MYLTNHSRKDMRCFQVKIIIRPIQVCRHDSYIICTILQVIAFTHFDTGNLSNCIRFIRIFKRRCQQTIFLHGLRGFSRINTGTSQKQQFLYLIYIRSLNHIILNHQIQIDEISPITTVCHYPTYMGSR